MTKTTKLNNRIYKRKRKCTKKKGKKNTKIQNRRQKALQISKFKNQN